MNNASPAELTVLNRINNFVQPYYARVKCHTEESENRNPIHIERDLTLNPDLPSWDELIKDIQLKASTVYASKDFRDFLELFDAMKRIHTVSYGFEFEDMDSHFLESYVQIHGVLRFSQDQTKFEKSIAVLVGFAEDNDLGDKLLETFYMNTFFGKKYELLPKIPKDIIVKLFKLWNQVIQPRSNSRKKILKEDMFTYVVTSSCIGEAVIDGKITTQELNNMSEVLTKSKIQNTNIVENVLDAQLSRDYASIRMPFYMLPEDKYSHLPNSFIESFFPEDMDIELFMLKIEYHSLKPYALLMHPAFSKELMIKIINWKDEPYNTMEARYVKYAKQNLIQIVLDENPDLKESMEGIPEDWKDKIFASYVAAAVA